MRTHVEFRSDEFPPYEGEEEQTRPGLWGRRLGEYLVEKLHQEGIETEGMVAEEWGWRLAIESESIQLWIGCGHYQAYPNGYLCFVEAEKPVLRSLFKRTDTTDDVGRVVEALDRILTLDPGISDVRWWER